MALITWVRALAVWLLMIGVEVAHGVFRTLLVTPFVGDFRARQIGVFTGSLLILSIACLFINWIRPPRSAGILVIVGLAWAVLTLGFEIGVGRFALGYSWDRIASDYDISQGGLLPLGLLTMVVAPLIAVKLRT